MRVVVQRVLGARALQQAGCIGEIGPGLVAFCGFGRSDDQAVVDKMACKLLHLRIFEDGSSKFGMSLLKHGGAVMTVSQFTLMGDTTRGRRPSFSDALAPEHAAPLYARFGERLADGGVTVFAGPFRARLEVEARNWGPFTMVLDLP